MSNCVSNKLSNVNIMDTILSRCVPYPIGVAWVLRLTRDANDVIIWVARHPGYARSWVFSLGEWPERLKAALFLKMGGLHTCLWVKAWVTLFAYGLFTVP